MFNAIYKLCQNCNNIQIDYFQKQNAQMTFMRLLKCLMNLLKRYERMRMYIACMYVLNVHMC